MSVPCVILGGGDGRAIDGRTPTKGLVTVAGLPMVEWVVRAACRAETVSEITVVMPGRDFGGEWSAAIDHLVPSDAGFVENLAAGLEAYRDDEPVLVLTADLPALTPEAIDAFIVESLTRNVDLTYPLVDEEDIEREFPGSRRTYVRVDGRRVTGGNVVLLTPWLVRHGSVLAERLFGSRKSAVRLAGILGPVFIAKYLSGSLRVSDVERRMETLSGGKCSAFGVSHASIGADVDRSTDVEVVERVLYSRAPHVLSGSGVKG
jgi:hypothetical protein